jgi:tetratricopeptide (TPR) repeat protein
MISRFNRLLSILVLIFISLYIVILNRESATFTAGGSWSITANLGVLLITAFSAGLLASSLIALFFGFKAWLRERKLLAQDRQRQGFLDGLVEARGLLAAHEWDKSQAIWQGLTRRDPTKSVARIELSRSLEHGGDISEALKVIESIRAEHTDNVEVLFRAFEIQKKLGNKTAAIDNLALVLGKTPCLRAAIEARDLSEELGRIADALEYHEQCIELGEDRETASRRGGELHFKLIMQDQLKDKELLKKELQGFLKRHPETIAAHLALAKLEQERGNNAEAAQSLINAAKAGAGLPAWNEASVLWLNEGQPEKALAAARSAAQGTTGTTRVEALLFRSQLQLGLNHTEEAEKTLAEIKEHLALHPVTLPLELLSKTESLNALTAYRLGKTSTLIECLSHLSGIDHLSSPHAEDHKNPAQVKELSPIYSTP